MKKMTPYPVHCSALSLAFAVGFTVSSAPVALAQPARPLQDALKDRAVQAAMADVDTRGPEAARLLATLGAIVSPSGREHARAEEVARRMRAIGLNRVTVDAAPNAVGVIPGRSGRALVFVSTLDDLADVAEHQKAAAASPHVEGSRVVGPGTNTSATTAEAISKHLGLEARLGNAGSSNMNVAIGGGTLAIGLGGSRGGQRGEPGEWADVPAMIRTAKHVVLLAGAIGAGR